MRPGTKILGIGAHCDDLELNALGTLLSWRNEYDAEIHRIICTNSGDINNDRNEIEQATVDSTMGYHTISTLNNPDGNLKLDDVLIFNIEQICNTIQPDIVITHTEQDFHQDHVAVAKAVKAVNRYSKFSVLSFPSQDPKQPFLANLHVDITPYMETKLRLLKFYKSQQGKPWLDENIIKSRNAGIGGMQWSEKFNVQYLKV